MTIYRKSRGSVQPYRVFRYGLDEGGPVIDTVSYFFDRNRNLSRNVGGTFHGNPQWKRDSVVGNYIRTQTNNYIDGWTSSLHNFNATTSFSVSVWIKPDVVFGTYPPFVNHSQAGANIGWACFCWAGGGAHNGLCYFHINDGTTAIDFFDANAPTCADGKWHLVGGVCDRVNQVGKSFTDLGPFYGNASISAVGTLVGDATSGMKVGQGPSFGGTDGFVGGLHDLRIHEGKVLQPTDIRKLYYEKMRVSSRQRRWELAPGHGAGGGGTASRNTAVSVIS